MVKKGRNFYKKATFYKNSKIKVLLVKASTRSGQNVYEGSKCIQGD